MGDEFKRTVRYVVEGPNTESFTDPLAAQQYFNLMTRRPNTRLRYRLKRIVEDTIAVFGNQGS